MYGYSLLNILNLSERHKIDITGQRKEEVLSLFYKKVQVDIFCLSKRVRNYEDNIGNLTNTTRTRVYETVNIRYGRGRFPVSDRTNREKSPGRS